MEEDKTKKIRGIAKDFGLCHMSLTTYYVVNHLAKVELVRNGYSVLFVRNDHTLDVLRKIFFPTFV